MDIKLIIAIVRRNKFELVEQKLAPKQLMTKIVVCYDC